MGRRQEISDHGSWLRALVREFPQKVSRRGLCVGFCPKVPSAFFIADCFLQMDKLLAQSLLVPTAAMNKVDLATLEAKRCKRLIGALRHLYRNSAFE